MRITKDILNSRGCVEKAGIMVRFTNPRIGWKEDGTLIVGWHEWKEKVFDTEELDKII